MRALKKVRFGVFVLMGLMGLFFLAQRHTVAFAANAAAILPDLDETVTVAPNKNTSKEGDSDSLEDLEKAIQNDNGEVAAKPDESAPRSPAAETKAEPNIEDEILLGPDSPEGAEKKEPLVAAPPPPPPVVLPPITPVPFRAAAEEKSLPPRPPAPPVRERVSSFAENPRNQITNLEFKMEGPASRIVISSHTAPHYREVRNAGMKQIVYFFDNTETPDRLQRAYDTTEFPSPVALFTILQMPNEKPAQTKLIVQLREDKEPKVIAGERGMIIEFAGPSQKNEPRVVVGGSEGNGPIDDSLTGDPGNRLTANPFVGSK